MKILGKILGCIISAVILILLLYNIYKFICVNVLKKNIATINGYAMLDVNTGSMEPTIQIGDIIIIDTKIKKYSENDIVTFYDKEGSLVTHRIISLKGNLMITKGDNNNIEDRESSTDKIVGKYAFRIQKGQKIISAFKNPIVIILIIIDGILYSVFVSIDRKGDIKLSEEEKEYAEFKKYKEKRR